MALNGPRKRRVVGGLTLWTATAVVALMLVPPGAAFHLPSHRLPSPLSTAGGPVPSVTNLTDSRHWVKINGSSSEMPPYAGATEYDPVLGGLVEFGGQTLAGAYLNGTWLFRGDRWTEICDGSHFNASCPTAPPARTQTVLGYDAADHEMLLFGGAGIDGYLYTQFSDTWALQNTTWVRLQASLGPGALETYGGSMVYDPAGGFLYMSLPYQGPTGSAYEFDNGSWTPAAPIPAPADVVFYDPDSGTLTASSPTITTTAFTLGASGWKASGWVRSPITYDYPELLGASFDPLAGEEIAFVAFYNTTNGSWVLEQNILALDGGNWTVLDRNIAGSLPYVPGGYNLTEMDGLTFDPAIGATIVPLTNWSYTNVGYSAANGSTWALTDPLTTTLTVSTPATDVGVGVQWTVGTSGGLGGVGAQFETPALTGCSRGEAGSSLDCSYTTPGTYSVDVVATDGIGDSALATAQVAIQPDPVATGTSTEAATTVGAPVGFLGAWAGGTAPLSGSWSFGDGAALPGPNSTHSYGSPGTYSATWSVSDAAGEVAARSVTIVVNPTLAVDAHVARIVVDAGVWDQFNSTLIGGTYPERVAWSFGDGAAGSGPNVSHSYSQPGEYLAAATATDYVGVSAQSRVYVEVEPAMVTAAGANETQAYVGSPVILAAGAVGGTAPYTYWWLLGDGQWDTASRFVHVFALAGVYGVTVEVNDSAGGTQLDQFLVNVAPAPAATPPSSAPPPGGPGGITGGAPPPSEFPRLTQRAGAPGPIPLGNAIILAGLAAVLVIALGSALDRQRSGVRRGPPAVRRRR